ncbi:transketolase [Candidatus Woesearchaeota archaeon]|nr:transketolase [Candidatus Woesearchaeota archaeon]
MAILKEKELKEKTKEIRRSIITMLAKAGSGHSAGALGQVELYTILYKEVLHHNPKKPQDPNRDFCIVSNGHTCPVLYATLADNGYFPKKELLTLRKLGSRLQGHPHKGLLPGVEHSGGPLGQGISFAVGLAASLRRDKKTNKVYCFVGDGELEEGQCWEALLFAAKEKLSNFILIVDRNYIQIDGSTTQVLHLDPLDKKCEAFGFHTISLDGNNPQDIRKAYKSALQEKKRPTVLIARTIPGKGVSFMENKVEWHGKAPTKEEAEKALEELE